jgi:hypothetical protein
MIGYFVAYALFIPGIMKDREIERKRPGSLAPESRLRLLLFSKLPWMLRGCAADLMVDEHVSRSTRNHRPTRIRIRHTEAADRPLGGTDVLCDAHCDRQCMIPSQAPAVIERIRCVTDGLVM